MTKNRRIAILAFAGALLCGAPARAAMVFTEQAAFDAALDRVHVESFESFSLGEAVASLSFDIAVTGAVSTDKVKENLIVAGGAAPGQRAWSLKGGTTTIDLSGLAVNAFGLTFEDRGPVVFTISLLGTAIETATVGDETSGFLGIVGTDAVTGLEIDWVGAQGRAVAFDDLRVGWMTPPAPVIPAPRSVSLGLAGLALFACPRRREV